MVENEKVRGHLDKLALDIRDVVMAHTQLEMNEYKKDQISAIHIIMGALLKNIYELLHTINRYEKCDKEIHDYKVKMSDQTFDLVNLIRKENK